VLRPGIVILGLSVAGTYRNAALRNPAFPTTLNTLRGASPFQEAPLEIKVNAHASA
jgi:hypothetical protein